MLIECACCKKETEHQHLHNCAHGIPDLEKTHYETTYDRVQRLESQLAEARTEINRRDKFCGKCENDQLVSLEQTHREGWEQGKQQASGICKADIQEHAITISGAQQETHNNCCNYLAKAIDAMEYNHGN